MLLRVFTVFQKYCICIVIKCHGEGFNLLLIKSIYVYTIVNLCICVKPKGKNRICYSSANFLLQSFLTVIILIVFFFHSQIEAVITLNSSEEQLGFTLFFHNLHSLIEPFKFFIHIYTCSHVQT